MEIIKRILELERIFYSEILQSSSGFTNLVFFVDNKYVVKIVNQKTKPIKLQKEIEFYKNVHLAFIPKYIASGNIEGIDYLIIEKIEGESLYKVWHKLDGFERKKVTKQIANILNMFHKQKGDWLNKESVTSSWLEKWKNSFELNISILNEKGFDTYFLELFRKNKLNEVFNQQNNCLVYNDAHFDNFIYNKGVVKLIDFDRVVFCSVDYELMIIKLMLDNPRKFASEEDEQNVSNLDYLQIWDELKKYCPEMFDFKYINERVYVYQFMYNLGQANNYNRKDWIEKQLIEFKRFILSQ